MQRRPIADIIVYELDEHYEVWISAPCDGVGRFMVRFDKTYYAAHEAREVAERLWHVARRYDEARRFIEVNPEAYGKRLDS